MSFSAYSVLPELWSSEVLPRQQHAGTLPGPCMHSVRSLYVFWTHMDVSGRIMHAPCTHLAHFVDAPGTHELLNCAFILGASS